MANPYEDVPWSAKRVRTRSHSRSPLPT